MKHMLSGYTVDQDYINRLCDISEFGNVSSNRTGTDSVSLFGESARFSLRNGRIPVVGVKSLPLKMITHELVWFLSGSTRIKYLKENNVHIWDSWVEPSSRVFDCKDVSNFELLDWALNNCPELPFTQGDTPAETVAMNYPMFETLCPMVDGDLPNIYQSQWFAWEDTKTLVAEDYYAHSQYYTDLGYEHQGTYNCNTDDTIKVVLKRFINQYQNVIDRIQSNPGCRRLIVEGWNVGLLDQTALVACHKTIQFYVTEISTPDRLQLALDDGLVTQQLYNELIKSTEEVQLKKLAEDKVPVNGLSSMLYMRSSDQGVGYPFNIAQYGVLTHIIGKMTGTYPLDFIWVGADVHVYMDQWDYTSPKGVTGGVSELVERYNELSDTTDEGSKYTPLVDTHVEAVLNNLTADRVIEYPFVKIAECVKDLKSDELHKIKFEDIQYTEYKSMGPVPFPKAAV